MKFRRYQCKYGKWFFPMTIPEFIFCYGKEEAKGRNWDYRTTYCPECREKRRFEQERGKKFDDRFSRKNLKQVA